MLLALFFASLSSFSPYRPALLLVGNVTVDVVDGKKAVVSGCNPFLYSSDDIFRAGYISFGWCMTSRMHQHCPKIQAHAWCSIPKVMANISAQMPT